MLLHSCCDLGEQTSNIEWGSGVFSTIFFAIKRVVLVGALIVLWKDNVSTNFVADCRFSVGNKTKTPWVHQCGKFPFVCVSSINTHFCHLTGGPSKLNNCGCETSARVRFILRQESSPPLSRLQLLLNLVQNSLWLIDSLPEMRTFRRHIGEFQKNENKLWQSFFNFFLYTTLNIDHAC